MPINISKKVYNDIVKKVGTEKMKAADVDVSCASSNDSQGQEIKPSSNKTVVVHAERKENALEKTTARIEYLHGSIVNRLHKSLEDAFEIGGLLFKQKEIVKQDGGRFTLWVKEHLSFSIRTAQRYMKLYQYKEALLESEVKTITEAYAHIFQKPTSDEIIDVDDSLNIPGAVVKASVDLDKLTLPKKKAKGLMRKFKLTHGTIDDFINDPGYQDCQGRYVKFVIELSSNNIHNKRIGEFICVAEKYLKPGGKIILHKK